MNRVGDSRAVEAECSSEGAEVSGIKDSLRMGMATS